MNAGFRESAKIRKTESFGQQLCRYIHYSEKAICFLPLGTIKNSNWMTLPV